MRKYLLCLFSFLLLANIDVQAQLPPYSVAPNFSLQDIDNDNQSLFPYLDSGVPVVLAVFNYQDLVGSWNYLAALNDAYAEYGPEGDDSIVFLAVESTNDATNNDLTTPTPFGTSWADHLDYPIINDQTGSFASLYGIGNNFPVIYVIYPNHLLVPLTDLDALFADPVGHIAELSAPSNYNNLMPQGENNVGILAYQGSDQYCQGLEPNFAVQNIGSSPLTSFTAVLQSNGIPVQTIEWTGTLAPYNWESLNFDPIESDVTQDLNLIISNPNGTGDDDNSNNQYTTTIEPAINISNANLEFSLNLANTNTIVQWEIVSTDGETPYSSTSNDSETAYSDVFTFDGDNCYFFNISTQDGTPLNEVISSIIINFGSSLLLTQVGEEAFLSVPFETETPSGQLPTASIAIANVSADGLLTAAANSNDNIASWSWNFGDGNNGTGQSVMHQYTQNGTFTVTLTVTNAAGLSNSYQTEVTVMSPPLAQFSFGQDLEFNGFVTFFNESSFGDNYTWNMGNGDIFEEAPPAPYTFPENATYFVCLTVTNDEFPEEESQECQNVVVNSPAFPDFNIVQDASNDGIVTLVDASLWADNYVWNWGDGTTDQTSGNPPTHTYQTLGDFDICLTVTNDELPATPKTLCKTITVTGGTGLEDLGLIDAFKLYPTVSSDFVNVQFKLLERTPNLQYKIINVQGQMIEHQLLNGDVLGSQNFRLELSDLASGLYYFILASDGEQSVKRFVVE